MLLQISGINMIVGMDGQEGKPMIQDVRGLTVRIRRPLRDLFRMVPEVQVDIQVLLEMSLVL
jgi:vacuolar protein sorting-associated protein 13A/C